MELIAEIDLTSNSSLLSFSNIPQEYDAVWIFVSGKLSGNGTMTFEPNNSNSQANYAHIGYINNSLLSAQNTNDNKLTNNDNGTVGVTGWILIPNYSRYTYASHQHYHKFTSWRPNMDAEMNFGGGGRWNEFNATTNFRIRTNQQFVTGTIARMYGV